MTQRISIIVAIAENAVIGKDGAIPWRLSTDMRRFKRITMGHHLIMGRKTWDSLGRPLPGRTSIVLSRSANSIEGVHVVPNLQDALEICRSDEEVFIIGGSEIYQLALPLAHRIYLTKVHADVEGDTHLSDLPLAEWQVIEEESFETGEKDEFPHTFQILERM